MVKKLTYLSVLASLIAASIISIDFRVFQLSLFRIIIMVLMLVVIIQSTFNNGRISLPRYNENSYSIKFMLIWFFYAITTLGWVQDHGDWFRAVYFIGLGVICVILYNRTFKTSNDILTAFYLMSIMVIIQNLIGWYEINTGNYMFLGTERIARYTYQNYPVSMFNNTNNFALFMLFSVFIAYICLVNSKIKIGKLVYLLTIVSSTYLLIYTSSRASLLGLITALLLFAGLKVMNTKLRYLTIIALALLFILILLLPGVIDTFLLMIDQNLTFNLTADRGSDAIRLNLIKNGLIFLMQTFGFGTGAGNVEYWMSNYGNYNTFGIANIHNWWMEILVGYGVVIFILYIMFYVKLFKSLYQRYRKCSDIKNKSISLGIICCMTGYVIASISTSTNIGAEWLWVFWALAISYQGIDDSFKLTKIEQGKL